MDFISVSTIQEVCATFLCDFYLNEAAPALKLLEFLEARK